MFQDLLATPQRTAYRAADPGPRLAVRSVLLEEASERQCVLDFCRRKLQQIGDFGDRRQWHVSQAGVDHVQRRQCDGLQRRDFIHIDDVCEGLVRLSTVRGHEDGLLVNMGTGVALSVRDVSRWIAAAVDADESLLQFGARQRSPGDADLIAADVSRLRETLRWVPPQRLQAGLDIGELFGAG